MSQRSKRVYEFAPFRLDAAERLLLRDGAAVPLPPKAFDLLLALIEHHGHLLEKDELLKTVWPDTFVEEVNLSYNISLIRKALGESENGSRYIETVPKRGYRFVGEVREAPQTAEAPPGSQYFIKDEGQAADGDLENRRRKRRARIILAALAAATLIPIIIYFRYFRPAPVEAPAIRAFILPPENAKFHFAGKNPGPVVVSPDGRRLAFVAATPDGKSLIWVRPLDALTAQSLAGTDGASSPFWSPDSQWLGFFVATTLKKIKVAGGPVFKLCDLASPGNTGTWSREDVIIFDTTANDPLYRVSAAGGAPSAVTKLDEARREVSHSFPYFLPDGRHFLYLAKLRQGADRMMAGIYVASLDQQEGKLLLSDSSNVAYGSGYLLFRRAKALMAQPFDVERLELTGEAFPIVPQVRHVNLKAVFSVSENGVLVYQPGTVTPGSQLVWFDRNGKQLGVLGAPAHYRDADLSPDGKKVAVDIRDADRQDIWLYDVARGLKTRFTLDSAPGAVPLWSPDGSRIIYCSDRKGPFDLYQRVANGVGADEALVESNLTKFPTSWSRDGRYVLYYGAPQTVADLWVLPMFGERKPFLFLQTEAMEVHGEFSPYGAHVAYASDESRQFEVYVTSFPGPGGKQQVSIAGGRIPRWRGDGKELFYLAADNKLMAAEVNIKGSALEISAVRPLFEILPAQQGRDFDVTADGQRFLVNTLVEDKESLPLTLVINWTADVKR
jgi:DNA-binding winged helix-turn-helix (wHTH) protein/Tol biopolymer transport system component